MKRLSAIAEVDKIEEKRKPEDFIGHRNRLSEGAPPLATNFASNNDTERVWEAAMVYALCTH